MDFMLYHNKNSMDTRLHTSDTTRFIRW